MIAQEKAVAEGAHAPSFEEARNLVDLLLVNAREPNKVAAKQKVQGAWRDYSWGEMLERTRRISQALIASGIKPGDRVCIFSATNYEWTLADLAIMGAQAITVPIYASNTPQEVEYIIKDSGARLLFFDHDRPDGKAMGRWQRLKAVMDRIPQIERFIGFEVASNTAERLTSLEDFEVEGDKALKGDPHGLEHRARLIGTDDLSCILYTSGTTGNPKGVMLTQGNWTYQAKAIVEVGLLASSDTVLLFLPLAHSFARVVEAAWLGQGFLLAFAEAVEKAVDNAAEVKATVMPSVPRVFEKAFTKVVADGSSQPGVKGTLFGWAMKQFDQYAAARAAGREYHSLQWTAAKRLVFSKIEQKLKTRFGGKIRLFISGGAPLPKKIGYFFGECGLKILEGYGLTETSAPTHANRLDDIRIGTIGLPFPQTEHRLAPDGELIVRGPQVMKGYWNRPQDTAEVLEADGWFHTGDIAEIDAQGYTRITDRKKDLIKTSGGKYIAPQELESALRSEPLIGQVSIIGDRRRFVAAIVTIAEDVAMRWAKEQQLPVDTYAEIVKRPETRARIEAAVNKLNATLPQYATVKKFAILNEDWSQLTGELTPKGSVRRKVIEQKYKHVIDELYGGESFD